MSTFRRPRLTSSFPLSPSIACQFAGGRKGRRVGWKRPKVLERINFCTGGDIWQTLLTFECFVSHLNVFSRTFSNTCTYRNTNTRLEIDFLRAQKVVWGRSIFSTWHHTLPTCFAWVGRVCSMCPKRRKKRGKVRWVRPPPFFATGLTCTLGRRGRRKILFGDYMRGRKLCDLDCVNYVLWPKAGFFFAL